MKTQYLQMPPASYRDQTKRLAFAMNIGIPSSISLVTNPQSDNISIALQRGAAHETWPLVNANRLNIVSAIESLLEIDTAYWCAVNQALNKNTPSS